MPGTVLSVGETAAKPDQRRIFALVELLFQGRRRVIKYIKSGSDDAVWRKTGDPSGVLGLCMGIPLFYEEISTPVLRVCQQSQSVSHFKLNSIIKSTGPSGTEVCQDHIPLFQISVNNPIPMPKLEFSHCVCLPTCKVATSLYVVPISAH